MESFGLTCEIVSKIASHIKQFIMHSRRIQGKQHKMILRIADKYYELILMVKNIHSCASMVSVDNMRPLRDVNNLLMRFCQQALCSLDQTMHLGDVRRLLSEKAADCIVSLNGLFHELDNQGMDPSKWESVNSSEVKCVAEKIMLKWDELLSVLSKDSHISASDIKREFEERHNGF